MSGGWSDKFCTKVSDRWLRVDLGSDRTISSLVVKHSGAGGEATAYNTRDFRFETRTASGSYTTAATVTGNTASVTTTTIAPRSARYVRLRVTAGEQANAAGPARIYELEVYSGAAPAAAPLTAYSGLDATGRAQRFEVGAYEAARGNLGLVGADATRSVDIATGYRAMLCRDAGLRRLHDAVRGPRLTAAVGLRPLGQLAAGGARALGGVSDGGGIGLPGGSASAAAFPGSPGAMADTTSPNGAPDSPTDLSKRTWKDTLKRTLQEFKEDDLTLLAAALTYYGVLSLFPALLVLLALLGLAGTNTIDTLLRTSAASRRPRRATSSPTRYATSRAPTRAPASR